MKVNMLTHGNTKEKFVLNLKNSSLPGLQYLKVPLNNYQIDFANKYTLYMEIIYRHLKINSY